MLSHEAPYLFRRCCERLVGSNRCSVRSSSSSVFRNVAAAGTSYDTTYSFTLTTRNLSQSQVPSSTSPNSAFGSCLDFQVLRAPQHTCISLQRPVPFRSWAVATCRSRGTYSLVVNGNRGRLTTVGANFRLRSAPLRSSVSPVPIPGSLVLFVSGLGLLGFWGWAKGRKGGSGSASFEAAAC